MMLLCRVLFGVCIVLLLLFRGSLAAARRAGRDRELPMLRWVVVGLSLTAISYLLRMFNAPQASHVSLLGFLCCLGGAVALGMAWSERVRLRIERPVHREFLTVDLNRVDSRCTLSAHQALIGAQKEAARRGLPHVDTEHLLLGLLREPRGGAVRVLARLGVSPAAVEDQLAERAAPSPRPDGADGLTDRAHQVMTLAAQEAHRFDSECIGTEHLLLGLVLAGAGGAAHVLFRQGVTVDSVRQEILAGRHADRQRVEG